MTGLANDARPAPRDREADDFERLFPLAELELNVIREATVGGRNVCVVRTAAGVFAFGAVCPHQGGSMCAGIVRGTMDPSPRNEYHFGHEGEVVVCPWHGYEFDMRTGESVSGVIRGRVGSFPVEVREGDVYCSPRRRRPPARLIARQLRERIMAALSVEQQELISLIRTFVDREVLPVASELDHRDEFPGELVEAMKKMGLFGITIPCEYGGLGLDLYTYALVIKELSRGWISLSGVINTHFMAAWMILNFGTDEQKRRYLPRMATGAWRSAYSMTEPQAGSDVQAIRTRARRDGDEFVIDGQKMWVTNGLRANMVMLLAVTDPQAQPRHRGMTAFILQKEGGAAEQPGLVVPPHLRKLGYRGVESTELVFDGFRTPADSVLGGASQTGQGFKQFMAAVELGRVNVAARAVGLATCALELAIAYASQRETFGKVISQHQAIQLKLAQMATRLKAAELLVAEAAQLKSTGARADLEAGMAKLFATETALEVTTEAMRIHGGYGYSQEYMIERLYRDAPLLILGEGSNEIQQLVIARRLLESSASGR
jgi:alkylation response protein AidB-like acyl-CoA dehydrogenase/nitrite reductase/ring-hydroxylating ferredoxin subunit